jgi:hypothetical protein
VRFRVFVRPCSVHRSRRAVAWVANLATIPLRRFLPGRHPPARACALAVFRRLAPALLFFRVAGAAARVIRRRFRFSATYRARAGWFSRPGRTRVVARPPTLVGFAVPFAALILSAGENRVSTPRAHVPFGSFLRRGCFSSRLSRQAVATVGETRRAASGLWPRGQAVPCGPPAPL